MPNVAVILAAAGKSSRFKDDHYKKPFADIDGKAVWLHSAEKFLNRADVKQTILVLAPGDRESFIEKFGANIAILGIDLVDGGDSRSQSVQNGLNAVDPSNDFVAIHDAARPCIADEWIESVFAAGFRTSAAILGCRVTSTIKRVDSNKLIDTTVSREDLWLAQTPQVFKKSLLLESIEHHKKLKEQKDFTDEAQLLESQKIPVTMVEGSPLNIKITTKPDLAQARANMKLLPKPKLQGQSHPFENNDLWR